jgi:hypothetical protein
VCDTLPVTRGSPRAAGHRLGPSMARRNQQLESWFWETEAGPQWLIRLVIAVFSQVGLRRGVGAETMSEFFAGVPLEQHGGCSPSTLRVVMDKLAHLIVETTEAWERESMAQGQGGPMVGAVDETFLERRMLVCMDLVSGDVWLAEVADDRPDETWYGRGKARLAPMKTRGVDQAGRDGGGVPEPSRCVSPPPCLGQGGLAGDSDSVDNRASDVQSSSAASGHVQDVGHQRDGDRVSPDRGGRP